MSSGDREIADARQDVLHALTFIDHLGRLDDMDKVSGALNGAIGDVGFTWFAVATLPAPELRGPIEHVLSSIPPRWARMYLEQNFVPVDPVLRECLATTMPFEWADLRYDPEREPRVHRFMEESAGFGVRHGFSFSVRQPRGSVSIVSLSGSHRPDLRRSTKPAVHLMALYALARIQALRATADPVVPDLSDREREVLTWSAVGKTSHQIADILGITERTVRAHISSAARKLDTTNKTAIVARALVLGLIAF